MTGRILVSYKGELLLPVFADYPEEKFGGFLATTNFRDPFIQDEINANGWMIWPPIRYSYNTVNNEMATPAPAPPWWLIPATSAAAPIRWATPIRNCTLGNFNWLGTDDQGRDVVARLLYGVRISVLFGLILTVLSSAVGIAAGAVQGYFGGWIDLIFQRFIEIWTSLPELYILLIIASILVPSFWVLLGILLAVLLGSAGGTGAGGIPARAQFRICPRRPRARRRQPHHHRSATCCPTPWWRR